MPFIAVSTPALWLLSLCPQAAPEAQLRELLEKLHSDCRKAAAAALGQLKASQAIPALEKAEGTRVLNALRRPEIWKTLAAKPVTNWPRTGVLDLKAIAEASGLRLDYSADSEAAGEAWSFMRWDANVPNTAAGMIEGIWSERYDLVLETDRVRVIPADKAVEFWRTWWAGEADKK